MKTAFARGWWFAMLCILFPFVAIGMIAEVAWDAVQERIDALGQSGADGREKS